ncbi:PREDICTED: probable cation-transporting ATPase 13A4 [Thamnophis sirtalis]|uniref:Cation-transporting ATPase n=1 Tax=Thamnophis sirtalis TaxID=35019 RepID=A0A6I9YHT1_9SAUR|nr:PREDICTED: probable cation-transporting ATPase 13A4 [Thamnophis sirtalis]
MGEKHGGSHRALLNEGEEAEVEIFGYKSRGLRRALCLAGYVLSCGGLLLLFHWKPQWGVWANCQPCSLEEADVVLLRTTDEFQICTRKNVTWIPLPAHLKPGSLPTDEEEPLLNRVIERPGFKVRSLQVQKIRYAWDFSAREFRKVGALEDHWSSLEVHARFGAGLSSSQQELRREICGPNTIDIEVTPIWKLLVKEQSVKLHQLVESHNSVLVKVFRKQTGTQEVESRHLVPGDTLILDEGRRLMPCDALLLSGQCIVNEGMLTGESLPITKTSLPQDCKSNQPWHLSSSEDSKRHLLFCGTDIIQAKGGDGGPARAVVLRTGFNTAKGDLVRSILYPKPMNFRLYRDAMQFLLCLVMLAAIGMVYAICVFVINGQEAGEVVKKALDVITIAVPPALPAALTTGIIYAQRRLKKKGVFCISPQRINVCGQLNLLCFDKTGTLTEDGLDLWGIVLAQGKSFQEVHRFSSGPPMPWGPAYAAMACCHSLMVLDGKIQGDPLDLKMFEATHWVPVKGLAVLRQFPFSSALQRMTVVAQEAPGDGQVFMKGAPEMVASFCQPETVPPSFARELQGCTSQGFRVIALAHKRLQEGRLAASMTREELESGLTFLGLLVMENRLKSQSRPVLQELSQAGLRSVMVTGDNLQTAITVARNAGMIPQGSRVVLVEARAWPGQPSASVSWEELEEPGSGPEVSGLAEGRQRGMGYPPPAGDLGWHFCLSGGSYEVLSQHFGHLLPQLLLNGTVFARMSPAQKAHLVQQFQQLDYYVGMCGDGANDCGALKEAHAGISLSQQAASVASPFTSQVPTIECVPELIRHGRAALVTSFCMFKYMALFSLASYIGVLLLYWQLNSFGNYQFLFQDLAITTLIGMTMSLNGPHPSLAPYRPPTQLIAPPLLLSVVLNLLLSLAVQLSGFLLVQQQLWYSASDIHSACSPGNATHGPQAPLPRQGFQSYENTSVWLLCTLYCLTVAVVFSKGRPFREPLYRNYVFVAVLMAQLAACLFFLFANIEGLYWGCSLLEWLIENRALWRWLKRAVGYQSSSRYKQLQRTLRQDPAWPPSNRTDFSGCTAVPLEGPGPTYTNPAFVSHEQPCHNC